MIGWGHMVNLVWSEEEEGISTEPRIGLAFEDWLTGYAMFLVRQSINKDTKEI